MFGLRVESCGMRFEPSGLGAESLGLAVAWPGMGVESIGLGFESRPRERDGATTGMKQIGGEGAGWLLGRM